MPSAASRMTLASKAVISMGFIPRTLPGLSDATRIACFVLALLLLPAPAIAHGGGLNACGCHFNRKTGECHCHRNYGCGCECQPSSCEPGPSTIAPAVENEVASEQPAGTCGVERWAVKILADPDAAKVQVDSPQTATIEDLRAMSAAFYATKNPRSTAEEQVYTVEGFLVGYKIERGDSDLHVVIRNDAGESMIVEFPHPDCMLGSRILKQATEARAKFLGLLRTPPTSRFVRVRKPIRVRVTGVLFFDRVHGQTGVAPNGVELHPVLEIKVQ